MMSADQKIYNYSKKNDENGPKNTERDKNGEKTFFQVFPVQIFQLQHFPNGLVETLSARYDT